MDGLLVSFVVFLFALIFYATPGQEGHYRRYVFPGLFILLAVIQIENFVNFILLLFAAILTYSGFQGFGIKMIEEKKGDGKK
jgi:4-amino-4-deoxy-L-arabinose transferase-like glycosyltransferase